MSLKVGDKVRVKASVQVPTYLWGKVKHGDIGEVIEVLKDGCAYIDFPSQKGWFGYSPEMEVVKTRRKSPEKVLSYGVIQKDGTLYGSTPDRELARYLKAELGGKQNGVTIVVLEVGKEIR